ncbi:hypothetical protein TRICI_000301 [Trichomonascus ciferrii]|uniref:Uncharacterized protein n=1 Tax=Trichomonascus ciferrii TaxID=44093 RepID=A0A642VDR3_9ASCO|nr:hypothetical protein TRICI_000301 [Trichomonascus ciferrii]
MELDNSSLPVSTRMMKRKRAVDSSTGGGSGGGTGLNKKARAAKTRTRRGKQNGTSTKKFSRTAVSESPKRGLGKKDESDASTRSPGRMFEPRHHVFAPGKPVIKNCKSLKNEAGSFVTATHGFYSPSALDKYLQQNADKKIGPKSCRPVRNRRPVKNGVTWSPQLEW